MQVSELTNQAEFYRAMHRLMEIAWDRRLTVEALLAMAELLDEPPTGDASVVCTVEL